MRPDGAPKGAAGLPRAGLVGLLALGALSQLLVQTQAFGENPVVLVPQSDAAVLWRRAGEIASGGFVDDMPLDTAPLPLWLAAAVRALGGGLAAFGAVQSLLHLGTAWLLAVATARCARAVLGEGAGAAGLAAGALYLVLDEPAAATSRVLGTSLQLFLGAGLLALLVGDGSRGGPRRAWAAGGVLGLLCLAYPPALGAVPLVALWAWRGAGPAAAAGALAAAALAIAPATAHNLMASGEPILISSQAGLTFYHGNNPGADGLIAPVGVVNEKASQARDSLLRARRELGHDAGWAEASAHWRARGLAWWADEPVRATGVALRKLWYGLTARRYGDVYQPWRERRDGVASWLWLAPVPVAWILPVALVALFGLGRALGRRRAAVLGVFVGAPLAVCVVFFYTPRYRAPAIVGAVPLAALAATVAAGSARREEAGGGAGRTFVVASALALAFGIAGGPVDRALGVDDDPDGTFEVRHLERMAAAYGQLGDDAAGRAQLARVLARHPADSQVRARLARLDLFRLGDPSGALEVVRGTPPGAPGHPELVELEARILATAPDPGLADPDRALALADGLVATFGPVPPLLDLRAMALARQGRFEEAVPVLDRALSSLTTEDPLRTDMAARRTLYVAGRPFLQPLGAEGDDR